MELKEIQTDNGWKVEIVEAGESISRLWIIDRQMRIGGCPVLVGGIAGVGTDPSYRNQGLSRRVMEASVELMRRADYDVSMLFGIEDFYHKFGFVTCMPERRIYLRTRNAERATKQRTIRPMRKSDLARITQLYNRENAARTASVVRDRTWNGFSMGSFFGIEAKTQVVLDTRERVCGYVTYDDVDRHCRAAEVGGQGDEVFSTILHFLARRAVRLRREKLSLSMPADHPFAHFCRHFGYRESTHFDRNAGPMGRLINLRTLLEKILPVLEKRWGADGRDRGLAISTELGSALLLGWKRGRLILGSDGQKALKVGIDQDAFIQLAMGYQTADDLKSRGKLKTGSAGLALLARLFPPQTAHMWWSDRF